MTPLPYAGAMHLGLVAIVVSEYDPAIRFFVDALGFELAEDSPDLTNDGRPKRWVVVRPPGAATGLLLARADGADQAAIVGNQAAGRVGFFLNVADFGAAYARMTAAGVEFLTAPRAEPYGRVVLADHDGDQAQMHRASIREGLTRRRPPPGAPPPRENPRPCVPAQFWPATAPVSGLALLRLSHRNSSTSGISIPPTP